MHSEEASQITTTFIPPHPLKTAVLLLVFNRPDTTKQVFEAIRKAKPHRLYVAADGPRADKLGEAEKVEQVRKIATQVDWDCEVKTLFRDENLGCKVAVSSAIDWFFENVEEGIILEDDCLPAQSFFWFCDELLKYYRHDTRIMQISGCNLGVDCQNIKYSYFFSKYVEIWGWATWKRAWSLFDVNIRNWPDVKKDLFLYYPDSEEQKFRAKQFDSVANNDFDAWDYQWNYTCLINNCLNVIPKINMISNIGFSDDATHTANRDGKLARLVKEQFVGTIKHPPYVVFNSSFEKIKSQHCEKKGTARFPHFSVNLFKSKKKK